MANIYDIIIESAGQIVAIVLGALLTYAINYLRVFVADKLKMQTLALALEQLDGAIGATVAELQQTLVDGMKEANEDGKLTEEEIKLIGDELIKQTYSKLSPNAIEIIKAGGIDIIAYIQQVAEAFVYNQKAATKA